MKRLLIVLMMLGCSGSVEVDDTERDAAPDLCADPDLEPCKCLGGEHCGKVCAELDNTEDCVKYTQDYSIDLYKGDCSDDGRCIELPSEEGYPHTGTFCCVE